MQLNALERAILCWISEHQPSLGFQLIDGTVARREYTGAGFYVYLTPDNPDGWDYPPVDGPYIESPQLDIGAGSILWLSQGQPNCLEIFAYGNAFPEILEDFALATSNGNV